MNCTCIFTYLYVRHFVADGGGIVVVAYLGHIVFSDICILVPFLHITQDIAYMYLVVSTDTCIYCHDVQLTLLNCLIMFLFLKHTPFSKAFLYSQAVVSNTSMLPLYRIDLTIAINLEV